MAALAKQSTELVDLRPPFDAGERRALAHPGPGLLAVPP